MIDLNEGLTLFAQIGLGACEHRRKIFEDGAASGSIGPPDVAEGAKHQRAEEDKGNRQAGRIAFGDGPPPHPASPDKANNGP